MHRLFRTATLFFFLLAEVTAWAQPASLERRFVPVIQSVNGTPLLELEMGDWRAFRYDHASGTWTPVPFQVDSRDSEGNFKRDESPDRPVDLYDEIVCLADDLGDRASTTEWLTLGQASQHPRIELTFSDPDDPSKMAWLYLYRTGDAVAEPDGYFEYRPGPETTPAADTLRAAAGTLAHNANGWMNYLHFFGDPRGDVLDRLKLRLIGQSSLPDIGSYAITEDHVLADVEDPNGPISAYSGPVRFFRDVRARLLLPFWPTPIDEADYQLQYFPYSVRISLDNFPLNQVELALFGLNGLRISMDFNAQATGMTFYSPADTSGHLIDGQPDATAVELEQSAEPKWVMATQEGRTVVFLFEISKIKDAALSVYYHDDQTGGTGDDTEDTGDDPRPNASYGDMGFLLRANGAAFQTDFLSLRYNVYFIDEGPYDASFARRLAHWEETPLEMTAEEQVFEHTLVSEARHQPDDFAVVSAYPNPFNPAAGKVRFQATRWSPLEDGEMVIYDVRGREVRRLALSASGDGTWDGRDRHGQRVPPGLYFYRLMADPTRSWKLIVLPAR